ncbi:MAG: hypothetical protein H2055_09505 [Sphingopyxis sp.]|nr:hypothetical protein [Sphingopyxis sp.]
MKREILAAGAVLVIVTALSGCTTFSFAPPPVQSEFRIAPSQSVCGKAAASNTPIEHDFRGARYLIDNFTNAYRCASHEAANGRQIFEVPSFLALVSAAIGPTFGLSDDARIAALGAASVYGRANSYYAPREKIPALDAALDAVLCIKSESVGVAFFDTRQGDVDAARAAVVKAQGQITKLQTALATLETQRAATAAELAKLAGVNDAAAPARASLTAELKSIETEIGSTRTELTALETALKLIVDPAVAKAASVGGMGISGVAGDETLVVSLHEQYFEMVSSGLLSVERILANRLKSAGKYDPAGLQAEIEKLLDEKKAADDKVKTPTQFIAATVPEQKLDIELRVAAIQPRLQACVVRAKLG